MSDVYLKRIKKALAEVDPAEFEPTVLKSFSRLFKAYSEGAAAGIIEVTFKDQKPQGRLRVQGKTEFTEIEEADLFNALFPGLKKFAPLLGIPEKETEEMQTFLKGFAFEKLGGQSFAFFYSKDFTSFGMQIGQGLQLIKLTEKIKIAEALAILK